MEAVNRQDDRSVPASRWILLTGPLGALLLLQLTRISKIAVYLDAVDRSGLIYAVPFAAAAAMLVIIRYPRLSLHLLAVMLPFNFVGGYYDNSTLLILAKIGVAMLSLAALLSTSIAPAANRAWMTRTALGQSALLWLAFVGMAVAIGFFGANRQYWVRESWWMTFFTAILPFGTLMRGRRHLERLLWSICAGVAALQVYAFWLVATGNRYQRPDAWEGGSTFFRAPYSCQNLFVLYLAGAALLHYAYTRELSRWKGTLLAAVVAVLGGGLLASMTRSLWLSAAAGLIVLLTQVRWDRRVVRACFLLAGGVVVSVVVVALVDRLSAESSGDWLGSAGSFLADLTSKDSASRVTRLMEWSNALDVWRQSPIVGMGFGYPYPEIDLGKLADSLIPDLFYMHNSYLNILAKAGIAGLGALLLVTWKAVAAARDLGRREGADAFDQILGNALVAGLIQISVLSLTMPVLTAGDGAAYFGMLVGMTAAAATPRLARDHLS